MGRKERDRIYFPTWFSSREFYHFQTFNGLRAEAEGKEERKEERKEGWFALHFKILIREELTHACTETALISPLPRERRGVKEDKQAGRQAELNERTYEPTN